MHLEKEFLYVVCKRFGVTGCNVFGGLVCPLPTLSVEIMGLFGPNGDEEMEK